MEKVELQELFLYRFGLAWKGQVWVSPTYRIGMGTSYFTSTFTSLNV